MLRVVQWSGEQVAGLSTILQQAVLKQLVVGKITLAVQALALGQGVGQELLLARRVWVTTAVQAAQILREIDRAAVVVARVR